MTFEFYIIKFIKRSPLGRYVISKNKKAKIYLHPGNLDPGVWTQESEPGSKFTWGFTYEPLIS